MRGTILHWADSGLSAYHLTEGPNSRGYLGVREHMHVCMHVLLLLLLQVP